MEVSIRMSSVLSGLSIVNILNILRRLPHLTTRNRLRQILPILQSKTSPFKGLTSHIKMNTSSTIQQKFIVCLYTKRAQNYRLRYFVHRRKVSNKAGELYPQNGRMSVRQNHKLTEKSKSLWMSHSVVYEADLLYSRVLFIVSVETLLGVCVL